MSARTVCAVALLILLGVAGCDDGFSPKGAISDGAILYCVLEVQPFVERYQVTATLTRVYDVEGFDPTTNTIDPTITRAAVALVNGNRRYTLEETLQPRPQGSRYPGCCWIVYQANGVPIRTLDSLHLEAILPDGQRLSAVTSVPSYKPLTTFPAYPRGVTTRLPPLYYGSQWVINWDNNLKEDHLFFPKLRLRYRVSTSSGYLSGERDVPLRYLGEGPERQPLYPQVTSGRELAFEFAALDESMAAISEGDSDKSRYEILGFDFDLVEFDFALSRYYASINGSLDQLSIRLDETVYSNIAHGYGVFGTSMANSMLFPVNATYAASFGYSVPLAKPAGP